jgi:hypothetical protein
MTTDQLLEKLTDAAERCGMKVRTEKGNFEGGRCRMGGEEVVMLNERDLPERRLAVLARALRPEKIEAVYLPPAVRKVVEEARRSSEQESPADAPGENAPGEEAPAHAP